ncbi:MAG: DUF2339 domain-containing protein [Luteitalea sp.]|nr:DUF2339 domain-containing protein [Luteitalea sp.]
MELLFLLLLMAFFAAIGIALLVLIPVLLVRRQQPTVPAPSARAAAAEHTPHQSMPPESSALESHPEATGPAPAAPRGEIETLIGTRWLLYIGVAAIILGLGYFVRYAFAQLWLNEVTRVGLAATAGVGLIALGERLVARGTPLFGQVLSSAGLVVLYVAVYAAYGYYALIESALAFPLLLGVTALAYVLARRYESLPFAALAVIGGFVTPFLAGGYRESPIALLTFDLVLAGGTVVIAARHDWPALPVLAYAATAASLLGWANSAYQPSLWLTTELFLTAFAAVFILAALQARHSSSPRKDVIVAAILSAPVLYYIVSLGLLAGHDAALLVFLVALALVGVMFDVGSERRDATLVFWAAAAVPFLVHAQGFARGEWLWPALGAGGAIYVAHLLVAWRSAGASDSSQPRPVPLSRVALIHLNGWWLFAVSYQLLGVHAPDWQAPATLGLAAVNGLVATGLWSRLPAAAMHHLGLALGLTAASIVIWLEGYVATVALAIEGCSLVWLGLIGQRRWARGVGELLVIVAGLRLVGHLLSGHAGIAVPFLNTLAFTSTCVVAVMYVTAAMYRRWEAAAQDGMRALLFVSANLVTLLALTVETSTAFQHLGYSGSWLTSPDLARQGTISALWAGYALVLVAIGLRRQYAPIRYLALALFAVTILKVFVIDLATLSQFYKMATVLVLGVLLLIVSYLYTKRPT